MKQYYVALSILFCVEVAFAQKIKEKTDSIMLEQINVGYGTQKKSVVTGTISSVKAKDIENIPTGRVEQTLQGRTSGVTIAMNSGQPGSAATVRVRGLTTFNANGNEPLWLVDGIVMDSGSVGTINQSDIESIEVLKDAASTAIYGTRAAKGVILITTKKGKIGRMKINYNGSYGISQVSKKLDLLDASQYATIYNEKLINAGKTPKFSNPSSFGKGTDWQDEIFNNAEKNSHEFSFSSGNDKSTFFSSFGYLNQQGIILKDISNYRRLNARLNSSHKLTNFITISQTFSYTNEKKLGIGNTNAEFGGPLSSALNLDPITPVVITDPSIANNNPYSNNPVFRDSNGNPYGISNEVGVEMTNPLAYKNTRLGNYEWADNFVGNVTAEIKALKNLKFKSSLGGKFAYWGNEEFTPIHYLSPTSSVSNNRLFRKTNRGLSWQIENTATYNKTLGNHNFTILLGQAAYVDNNNKISEVTLRNLPVNNHNEASFNFGGTSSDRESFAFNDIKHTVSSLFGRLNYDYNERYIFTAILRRDGSSRFGKNKKYGFFPSFSAGWNVYNEKFWKENNIISNLKLKTGYGIVGNDDIEDHRFLSTISSGNNYEIGGKIEQGYNLTTLANPNLAWEETSQATIGTDMKLFRKFNLSVDYFNKKTKGILQSIRIPDYIGTDQYPAANVADMKNEGLEIEVGYKNKFKKLNFSANGSFSYLKNEVTYIGNGINFITNGSATFQSIGNVTRTEIGNPYNSFYGFIYNGIFQNQQEINNYVYTNSNNVTNKILPNSKPGDFKWADLNNDGKIDDNDKTFLGSPLPKYTFGLTINLEYENFDFMIFTQGVAGNKIFKGLRRVDIINANYETSVLNRWTGEGTSNSHPRVTTEDTGANYSRMSDFYLEKGDYLRLKLIQLGYSLPKNLTNSIGASKIRFYTTIENLVTFTKYSGFDPEIGGNVLGIDKGMYPQSRTFLFGANIQF